MNKMLKIFFILILLTTTTLVLAEDNIDDNLKVLRLKYTHETNIDNRASILLQIAEIYVQKGEKNRAKQLYRQIIKHYSQSQKNVKIAKQRLLNT